MSVVKPMFTVINKPCKGIIRKHRTNTVRADIIHMLGLVRGATMAEICKKTKLSEDEVKKYIYAIHYDLNYGIRTTRGGKMKLLSVSEE